MHPKCSIVHNVHNFSLAGYPTTTECVSDCTGNTRFQTVVSDNLPKEKI